MGRESLVPWIAFLLLSYVILNKVISLLWENNVSLSWLWIFFFLAVWCLWKHWLTLRCYTRVQDYHHCYHPCVRSHLKQDQAEAWQQGQVTCVICCMLEALAEEAKCLPWGESRKLQQESIHRSRTSAYFLSTQSDFFFSGLQLWAKFFVSLSIYLSKCRHPTWAP